MNGTDLVASALVGAGLTAEICLARIFLQDWRDCLAASRGAGVRRSSSRWVALVGVAGVALAAPAHADEPPRVEATQSAVTSPAQGIPEQSAPVPTEKPLVISTDRPSFDDTAGIVPRGHLQLETGYTFTLYDRSGTDTKTNNAPEVLARYTVIEDRLEFRLSTSGYVWTRSSSDGTSTSNAGFSDVVVGFKLKLTDQEGWIPRLAILGATTVGAGSDGISNQDVEPIGKLIWQYDLGKGWGVYGNFNIAYATSSGTDRFVQGQAGVCVTYAANDKLSFFGEYFVFGPNAKGTDAAHYIDFGAAYLLTNRVQLDVRAGFGLNKQANNFLTGAGISFLF